MTGFDRRAYRDALAGEEDENWVLSRKGGVLGGEAFAKRFVMAEGRLRLRPGRPRG
jgi:hypothetical protein